MKFSTFSDPKRFDLLFIDGFHGSSHVCGCPQNALQPPKE